MDVRLTDVVDDGDVRVVDGARRLGLVDEPLLCPGLLSQSLREELEGDEALESGILRLIDYSHPAFAELVENAVVGNR